MEKRKWTQWLRIFGYVIAGAMGSMFAAADALGRQGQEEEFVRKLVPYAKNWGIFVEGESENPLAEALQRIEGDYELRLMRK